MKVVQLLEEVQRLSGTSPHQGSQENRLRRMSDAQVVRASDVISERLVNVTDIEDMVETNR